MCKVRIYDYLRVNVKTHLCVSDAAHRGENITFYKRTQIKTAAVRLPSKIPLAGNKKVILSWQNITEVNVKVTVEERFSKSLKYQILNWLKYQKYQKKLIIGLVIWSDCPVISLICHHWRHAAGYSHFHVQRVRLQTFKIESCIESWFWRIVTIL